MLLVFGALCFPSPAGGIFEREMLPPVYRADKSLRIHCPTDRPDTVCLACTYKVEEVPSVSATQQLNGQRGESTSCLPEASSGGVAIQPGTQCNTNRLHFNAKIVNVINADFPLGNLKSPIDIPNTNRIRI